MNRDQPAAPTAREIEAVLREHVLDVWFPRCIDTEHGGFLCDFDRVWKSCGPHHKFLEFQARQTLLAAEACRVFPDDQGLRQAALHGFHYLQGPLWDTDSGGWFHRLDRAGRPLEAETKHAHGMAYAIEACAAVHEATGEPGALDLARAGFEWLERYSRDRDHGGYFGFLTRNGTVIRDPAQSPLKAKVDTIGTEIGLKDANVHSDLLETFVYLYRSWPDPGLRESLAELLDRICDRMIEPSTGAMHIFVTADWRPLPHLARAGYQCQGTYRLSTALGLTGDDAKLRYLAIRMMDWVLQYLRDRRGGGFFYAGPATPPLAIGGHRLTVRYKPWWIQAEALKALCAVSSLAAGEASYAAHFASQWDYLRHNLLDHRHGGFFSESLDMLGWLRRPFGAGLAPATFTKKGDVWKDASHDGRALLYCLANSQ